MKPIVTRIGVLLALCSGGLAVSQALSWERWVAPVQVAGEAVLAQEIQPATSSVAGSRFARPVPRGWAAPSLVGERSRPGAAWQPRLGQLGLPVAAQAPRLGVGPAGDAATSMEFDAGARHGPPPLAASVKRVVAALPQAPEVSSGSMPGRAGVLRTADMTKAQCEKNIIPLPKVRLIKDVLEAMPDMCDERIFGGKWYCDIMCGIGGCHHYSEMKLKREADAEGYQIISWEEKSIDTDHHFHARWIVDRKWHQTGKDEWYARGRPQVALSCNGKSDSGHSVLSVNYQHPNGHKRLQIRIYIDKAGAMTFDQYDVWKEKGNGNGKIHKEPYGARRCRRSFEEYP